jgi:hypothetical protein
VLVCKDFARFDRKSYQGASVLGKTLRHKPNKKDSRVIMKGEREVRYSRSFSPSKRHVHASNQSGVLLKLIYFCLYRLSESATSKTNRTQFHSFVAK